MFKKLTKFFKNLKIFAVFYLQNILSL